MWKSRPSEILANSALWGLELRGRAGGGRGGNKFHLTRTSSHHHQLLLWMTLERGCWQISSSHSYCKDAFLKKIIIKEFTVSTLDQPCFLSILSCIPSNWQQNGQVETGNMICLKLQQGNGQAVIFLTGLLFVVFISEISLWQQNQTLCPLGNHQSIWSGIFKRNIDRNEID